MGRESRPRPIAAPPRLGAQVPPRLRVSLLRTPLPTAPAPGARREPRGLCFRLPRPPTGSDGGDGPAGPVTRVAEAGGGAAGAAPDLTAATVPARARPPGPLPGGLASPAPLLSGPRRSARTRDSSSATTAAHRDRPLFLGSAAVPRPPDPRAGSTHRDRRLLPGTVSPPPHAPARHPAGPVEELPRARRGRTLCPPRSALAQGERLRQVSVGPAAASCRSSAPGPPLCLGRNRSLDECSAPPALTGGAPGQSRQGAELSPPGRPQGEDGCGAGGMGVGGRRGGEETPSKESPLGGEGVGRSKSSERRPGPQPGTAGVAEATGRKRWPPRHVRPQPLPTCLPVAFPERPPAAPCSVLLRGGLVSWPTDGRVEGVTGPSPPPWGAAALGSHARDPDAPGAQSPGPRDTQRAQDPAGGGGKAAGALAGGRADGDTGLGRWRPVQGDPARPPPAPPAPAPTGGPTSGGTKGRLGGRESCRGRAGAAGGGESSARAGGRRRGLRRPAAAAGEAAPSHRGRGRAASEEEEEGRAWGGGGDPGGSYARPTHHQRRGPACRTPGPGLAPQRSGRRARAAAAAWRRPPDAPPARRARAATNRRPAPAPARARRPSSAGTDRLWGASLPATRPAIPRRDRPAKAPAGRPPSHRPARPSPSPRAARRAAARTEGTARRPSRRALCGCARVARRVACEGPVRQPLGADGTASACETEKHALGRAERPPPGERGPRGGGPSGTGKARVDGLRLAGGGAGRPGGAGGRAPAGAKKGPAGTPGRPDAERRQPPRDVLPPRRGRLGPDSRQQAGIYTILGTAAAAPAPGRSPAACRRRPPPSRACPPPVPGTCFRASDPTAKRPRHPAKRPAAITRPPTARPALAAAAAGGWKCRVCAASCLPCGRAAREGALSKKGQRRREGGRARATTLSRPAPGGGRRGGGGVGRASPLQPCSPLSRRGASRP
ncbi:collagen, type I, alpha 1b-like [Equus asinus]|uniref:collagen, type I, alpha 1b-like n=1 Tax=Equus asinus TaxID=9793 RepID=UPI0038F79F40